MCIRDRVLHPVDPEPEADQSSQDMQTLTTLLKEGPEFLLPFSEKNHEKKKKNVSSVFVTTRNWINRKWRSKESVFDVRTQI